jgi:hypothetical protein
MDFPVPGGPMSRMLFPFNEVSTIIDISERNEREPKQERQK